MPLPKCVSLFSRSLLLVVTGVFLALGGIVALPTHEAAAEEKQDAATAQLPDFPAVEPLPKGAVACLGAARFKHGNMVNEAVLSSDGKALVTVSSEAPAAVKVWNVADGSQLYQIKNYSTYSAAFLPDNKSFVLGEMVNGGETGPHGAGRVLFFDLQTGKETRQIDWPVVPETLVVSPDGKMLASWTTIDSQGGFHTGKGDKTVVCLLDLASGEMKHRLEGSHPLLASGNHSQMKFLSFTPDGKSIAAGSWDKTVTLWDVALGKTVRSFGGEKQPASQFALANDGKTLALACDDQTIRGLDLSDGTELFKFTHDLANAANGMVRMTFAPDGKSLALSGYVREENVYLPGEGVWSVGSGKRLCKLPVLSTRLLYAPDGKTLISCTGYNGAIRLFNSENGFEPNPQKGHTDSVVALAFAADGQTLISESCDLTLRWWDVKTGKEKHQWPAGYSGLYHATLVLSDDGRVLAHRADPKTICLHDTLTGKELRSLRVPPARSPTFGLTPDGKTLVVAERDGAAVVWNTETGVESHRIDHPFPNPEIGNQTVVLSSDASLLAYARPNECVIFDAATKEVRHRFKEVAADSLSKFVFSEDKKVLFVGTYQGHVCVLDAQTGKETLRFKADDNMINCLVLSPDGSMIATSTGFKDSVIRVWQRKTGKMLREFPANGQWPYTLAFSPDSTLLASGGANANILLWDVRPEKK